MDDRYIPHRSNLYIIAKHIKTLLFNNTKWRLDHDALMFIFDILSRAPAAPNTNKIPWGQAITAVNNIHAVYHKIGTRGSYLQQQVKQRLTCGVMHLDNNNRVTNRKLLNKLLPHKQWTATDDWIIKCAALKVQFNDDDIDILCDKHDNVCRKSHV